MKPVLFLLLTFSFFAPSEVSGQADTIPTPSKKINRYDSISKIHPPRTAAIRSAILPGLGQIYNKKYWKLPIVYGALGTCAGIFFYNLNNYKDTRFAYRVKYNMRVNRTDSALFSQIDPLLKPIDEESLRYYRDQFRRDIDYSVLFFLVLWGLNVVDATVDAHLKSFDVGPDLSLQVKPGLSALAGTSGLSVVLKIGK
ncbi:MAG: hypothetical protein FJX92_08265 [Bacteroidetes bacterium]|nr:hypothetical protein [Bacteroidota bacterium]